MTTRLAELEQISLEACVSGWALGKWSKRCSREMDKVGGNYKGKVWAGKLLENIKIKSNKGDVNC